MDNENNIISNLKRIKRYFLPIISTVIPYISGIIFIDAFSKYYYTRKCEVVDETMINLCSIIKLHHIFMINFAGVMFVISAIVLMILKNYHKLNFTQINFMYLCSCTFIFINYLKPELLIIVTSIIFILTYFLLIRSKYNFNILNLAIIFFFTISFIYPFARGFKDFVYYYTEDKWISFSDFPKHKTGKEVWTKDIQTLLLGINELELKEFSSNGIREKQFIAAAAWPIRHVQGSRWIVHKKGDISEKCKLKWASDGVYISFC